MIELSQVVFWVLVAAGALPYVLVVVLGRLLAASEAKWHARLTEQREQAKEERHDLVFQLLAQRPAEAAHAISMVRKAEGKAPPQPPRAVDFMDIAQFAGETMPPELRKVAAKIEAEERKYERKTANPGRERGSA